ncbi:type II toxin-antitoxin system ParD family antitoxin [Rhizobium sp. NFR12]|uniref:ribbon-helix-helix domain-containing protein n=1 Tax=Rhizobium sp. NFR12 TaxID=1566261 RepID=UPI0008A74CB0|nr:type II toxin-antitoxin system ParD family antitoxin [Rhizobium sp. NFR12]SEH21517.1 putative addiction module antidote protein, CC2985 family [Rhizobium sp. NFR12]
MRYDIGQFQGAIMPPCNVVLTEHHQQVIAQLLETGRYQNASEIVGDALRLICPGRHHQDHCLYG